jgi:hypothetical protein
VGSHSGGGHFPREVLRPFRTRNQLNQCSGEKEKEGKTMSPSIKQKKAIPVFLVALVLACFAILRSAQAGQPPDIQNVNVLPPPPPPFQRPLDITMESGRTSSSASVVIPAGKTVVVEFVSARALLPAGEQLVRFVLFTPDFVHPIGTADLLWNFQASNGNTDFFVTSQQIRLYGRDRLEAAVFRDVGAGTAVIRVNVIGYLVNTP